MAHYEQRLEEDLGAIRQRVRKVAQAVEENLKRAVHAVLTGDRALASQVIMGDKPINREIRAIDKLCHGLFLLSCGSMSSSNGSETMAWPSPARRFSCRALRAAPCPATSS